jgi:HK97 family phage portal protein
LAFIEKQHKGAHRAGKTIVVGGGAELVPIPISLQDAQFAEVTRLTIAQAATIYQVPIRLVLADAAGGSTRDADADWRHLLTFGLGPFFVASEEAFSLDEDLFDPDTDGEDLTVKADPDALLKLNPEVQANVDHLNIQDGVKLVDEVRAMKGLGPLPPVPKDWTQHPGQIPQITPVGGSPNPTVDTTAPTPDPTQQ